MDTQSSYPTRTSTKSQKRYPSIFIDHQTRSTPLTQDLGVLAKVTCTLPITSYTTNQPTNPRITLFNRLYLWGQGRVGGGVLPKQAVHGEFTAKTGLSLLDSKKALGASSRVWRDPHKGVQAPYYTILPTPHKYHSLSIPPLSMGIFHTRIRTYDPLSTKNTTIDPLCLMHKAFLYYGYSRVLRYWYTHPLERTHTYGKNQNKGIPVFSTQYLSYSPQKGLNKANNPIVKAWSTSTWWVKAQYLQTNTNTIPKTIKISIPILPIPTYHPSIKPKQESPDPITITTY
ncbi:hypothetical protein G9A89_000304 [Geosiphon pyriformis]|nr:hypothetical protein G9A89_000304 [Geosiphon pyriformis]